MFLEQTTFLERIGRSRTATGLEYACDQGWKANEKFPPRADATMMTLSKPIFLPCYISLGVPRGSTPLRPSQAWRAAPPQTPGEPWGTWQRRPHHGRMGCRPVNVFSWSHCTIGAPWLSMWAPWGAHGRPIGPAIGHLWGPHGFADISMS